MGVWFIMPWRWLLRREFEEVLRVCVGQQQGAWRKRFTQYGNDNLIPLGF